MIFHMLKLKKPRAIRHIFIDMDNTIADFNKSPLLERFITPGEWRSPSEMYEPGFFETLPLLPGAASGVREVIKFARKYDIEVHILSKPLALSAHCYSEKVLWIMKQFPELVNHIILCQDKSLLARPGCVLIDDSTGWAESWSKKGGLFIRFEEERSSFEYWKEIIAQLESVINPIKK